MEEATAFESGARKAIDRLFATGRSAEYRLKTNPIWITFIANQNSTKADQRTVIAKELSGMRAEQSDDTTPIAIFSMNWSGGGVSWESAFLTPPDRSP